MCSNPRLRAAALSVALGLFGAACSASSNTSGAQGEGLAFNDEQTSSISGACDQLRDILLGSDSLFDASDQEALMTVFTNVAPELAVASADYLSSRTNPTTAFMQRVDDATYAACALPAYSAAALLAETSTRPTDLPCFAYQPEPANDTEHLYEPLDCATGELLFLRQGGIWKPAAPAGPSTTAPRPELPDEPTTSESTTTTTEAPITTTTQAPTTTQPPAATVSPQPTTPGGSEPDTPPVTDENGDPVETTASTFAPYTDI